MPPRRKILWGFGGVYQCSHSSKLYAQALTYSLALLRHWNGLPSNYVALIDVDEYIVIDQPKARAGLVRGGHRRGIEGPSVGLLSSTLR